MERAALSRVWGILLSGPVLSAVWLFACGAYIHTQVGWDVLPTMLPNEQTTELNGATDKTVERLRDVADTFRRHSGDLISSTDRAGVKAKDAAVLFETQTEALLKAANSTSSEAQRARRRSRRSRTRS